MQDVMDKIYKYSLEEIMSDRFEGILILPGLILPEQRKEAQNEHNRPHFNRFSNKVRNPKTEWIDRGIKRCHNI